MHIWLDLANSPHVLLFRPIIRELEKVGCRVTVTSRDFAQTVSLADSYHIPHAVIGEHGGKSSLGKLGSILSRARSLASHIGPLDVDLALSHNSYSQALAAFWLRIPTVTMMDYEHQPANFLSFFLAKRILVPDLFPCGVTSKHAVFMPKMVKYRGIKEEIYLSGFRHDPSAHPELSLPSEKIVVCLRPAPTKAVYHRFANPLFEMVFSYLAGNPDVHVVFLPRYEEQKQEVGRMGLPNVTIPSSAIDGPTLLHRSDMMVGAGGTMNREAVVLGIPVYTVFKGNLGAIDKHLIQAGRMIQIAEPSDITRIKLVKRSIPDLLEKQSRLIHEVVRMILKGNERLPLDAENP